MRSRTTTNKAGASHLRAGTLDDLTAQQRPTCFVIQPFDQGRFDKRYEDAFKPALAQAGFYAYRVDEDPNAEVLIDAIEAGIRSAAICLADVTTDNPNVWYELGFAYAAGKPVILTCCDEREGELPFDIRHRKVIQYKSESGRDFEELKERVTERALALFDGAVENQMNDADPIAPQDGLPQREIQLLGVIAGATPAPGTRESVWSLQSKAESVGLTPIAIGLAFRGLARRGFVEVVEMEDRGECYDGGYITDRGWDWMEEHANLFNLAERQKGEQHTFIDDDIPF